MSNNSAQSLAKKLLLPLGALVIGLGISSQAFAGPVKAGPIWNNNHAKRVCPQVCRSVGLRWTGHWYTNNPGKNSVCDCVGR